jgi:chain length determinant protein tyrosine kinase EpsG
MRVSDLIPLPAERSEFSADERLMGALLVQAGRLKPEDAERILKHQQERGVRFGDAGRELGLLEAVDIEFALARQFNFPYLRPGESKVSEEVVAAYDPFGAQAEALRNLRSELKLRWFDRDGACKALAVISGARGEGRSYIAANLAMVFAQLGERTLLIDADLRNPRQHQLFGIEGRIGLSAVLSERAGPEAVQRVTPIPNLSVLPAGARPPNPVELLARPVFGEVLRHLAAQVDVVLLDCPATGESADAQTIAVQAGAALIVARKNSARKWRVQGTFDRVAQARAMIVGAVLNDF